MSENNRAKPADHLHLIVFKDELTSRSFKIPFSWLNRLGLLLALILVLLFGTTLLAVRYYRMASSLDPSRFIEMEREIRDLKLAQSTQTGSPLEEQAQAPDGINEIAEPIPTEAPVPNPMTKGPFGSFSAEVLKTPLPTQIPIKTDRIRVGWNGDTLKVSFNILYTATDGGNQQGYITVFARGPSLLLAYPDQLLSFGNESTLIPIQKGESFSVSRFRAVSASFASVPQRDQIKSIHILIFSRKGELLISENVPLSAPGAPKKGPSP